MKDTNKLNNTIKLIRKKVAEFENSSTIEFKDIIKPNWRPKSDVLSFPGVYAIYEKRKGLLPSLGKNLFKDCTLFNHYHAI